MFHYFNSNNRSLKQDLIIKTLSEYICLDVNSDTKIFYYYDPQLQIYGAATIKKYKFNYFIKSSISKKNDEDIWVLNDIFFKVKNERILESPDDFMWQYSQFLHSLYEQLKTFSVIEDVSEIYTYLDSDTQDDLSFYVEWPIVWEMETQNCDQKVFSQCAFDQEAYRLYTKEWMDKTKTKAMYI